MVSLQAKYLHLLYPFKNRKQDFFMVACLYFPIYNVTEQDIEKMVSKFGT